MRPVGFRVLRFVLIMASLPNHRDECWTIMLCVLLPVVHDLVVGDTWNRLNARGRLVLQYTPFQVNQFVWISCVDAADCLTFETFLLTICAQKDPVEG